MGEQAVLVETDTHRESVDAIRDRLITLQHTWQIEGASPAGAPARPMPRPCSSR